MFVVHSYPLAILFCVLTMLCWGSWANTRKLARKDWRFELFYWDYALGVLLLTLVLGLTLGSAGTEGRSFIPDLSQASSASIGSALLGGAIFNLANILLVAAIDIAGMAVAFPVGIGLALIIGVIVNYLAAPAGNVGLLSGGVALVTLAIILDAALADVPERYREEERAIRLVNILSDAVERDGMVICPAKAWEIQDYARDADCRIAIFATDDRVSRRDRPGREALGRVVHQIVQ